MGTEERGVGRLSLGRVKTGARIPFTAWTRTLHGVGENSGVLGKTGAVQRSGAVSAPRQGLREARSAADVPSANSGIKN